MSDRPSSPPPGPPADDHAHRSAPAASTASRRPLLRVAILAWTVVGVAGAGWVIWQVATALAIVVIPLVLALFPAAVLAPVVAFLTRRRVPASLAALAAMILAFGVVGGVITAVAPNVGDQIDDFRRSIDEGIESIEEFLAAGRFGLPSLTLEEALQRVREALSGVFSAGGVGQGVLGALVAVTETLAGILFGLVALFFYLKDGPKIARWVRNLFPESMRRDAEEVGVRSWQTLGQYIRGQLLIALIDAILIGIGILVLGVPLALPLVLLVFVGGLFPLVGAVVAGFVAVLVALATEGLVTALILLGVILVVQEVEGDLLAPLILGRATKLHPLATLAALTAGAVLLGALGAFLAIPVTASLTRAMAYLRDERNATDDAGSAPTVAAT